MLNQAARLTDLGIMVRFGGSNKGNVVEVHAAISYYTSAVGEEFRVVPHYLEDFIATFKFKHHRDMLTVHPGRFTYRNLDIMARTRGRWPMLIRLTCSTMCTCALRA